MILKWDKGKPVQMKENMQLPQFELNGVETREEKRDLFTGKLTYISVWIRYVTSSTFYTLYILYRLSLISLYTVRHFSFKHSRNIYKISFSSSGILVVSSSGSISIYLVASLNSLSSMYFFYCIKNI